MKKKHIEMPQDLYDRIQRCKQAYLEHINQSVAVTRVNTVDIIYAGVKLLETELGVEDEPNNSL